jgi:hypothetical protein
VYDNRTLFVSKVSLDELPALMLCTFENKLRRFTSLTGWTLVHDWNPCRCYTITVEIVTMRAKGWMTAVCLRGYEQVVRLTASATDANAYIAE